MNETKIRLRHRKDLCAVIGLFSLFSVLLLTAAWYASGLAPRLMERNYRTVKYAAQMQSALTAIYLESSVGREAKASEIERFDANLAAEKMNITEIGEPEVVASIDAQWSMLRGNNMTPSLEAFQKLSATLEVLSSMNEKAMHAYEEKSKTMSYTVLLGGVLSFALVLLYTFQIVLNSDRTEAR